MAKTNSKNETNRKTLEITEKEYSWKKTEKPQWNEELCKRRVGKLFNENMLGACSEVNKRAVSFIRE